ncbi:cell division protein FtsQ/DivIB [Tessaracoccus flavescens]|uniref:cell division protein FtsQ/DivIB n=1 Tax=Tessaracoccus flavescens TaxID=399497 RepID=UPI000986F573|nr:FtsQ-type POTRA domain-containing protein [Tessaracoccus flavescens]
MTQPLPPGAFAKALQDRREAERRRRLIIWGSVAGLVVVLGVGIWLALFSPVFAARQVVVDGTELLTPEQVTEAAAVELDVPLLRQDTEAIAQRVRDLAPVLDVEVHRDLPDTVRLDVTERELVYQLVRDEAVSWVDRDGVVFNTTPKPTAGVVQVKSDDADDRLRRDIATVVANIPDDLRPQVSLLTAEAVDRIGFTLSDDREIVWGSAEESQLKGDVLAALLDVEAKVYDVSAPRHPTTK